jgi:hypothetical protein
MSHGFKDVAISPTRDFGPVNSVREIAVEIRCLASR